ncbi:unnamed protein product [Ambrosiozyma monospora]|uniref:Unnamed protein product n=1 Tax=Ambrosiozyma monospora TaxID=43982 RepID=A0ACB5TFU5_AMBMO|nr:unnamed protein product [Ambrosiozyma monospora]
MKACTRIRKDAKTQKAGQVHSNQPDINSQQTSIFRFPLQLLTDNTISISGITSPHIPVPMNNPYGAQNHKPRGPRMYVDTNHTSRAQSPPLPTRPQHLQFPSVTGSTTGNFRVTSPGPALPQRPQSPAPPPRPQLPAKPSLPSKPNPAQITGSFSSLSQFKSSISNLSPQSTSHSISFQPTVPLVHPSPQRHSHGPPPAPPSRKQRPSLASVDPHHVPNQHPSSASAASFPHGTHSHSNSYAMVVQLFLWCQYCLILQQTQMTSHLHIPC